MSDEAEVVAIGRFSVVRGESLSRPEASNCAHHDKVLNLQARTLDCKKCGTPVDPFDFVASLIRRKDEVLSLRKERHTLVAKVAALKETLNQLEVNIRREARGAGLGETWLGSLFLEVEREVRKALMEDRR